MKGRFDGSEQAFEFAPASLERLATQITVADAKKIKEHH
jgi:hypothetical protein